MSKNIIKRTEGGETLYFGTHSDAVQVGEGNEKDSLTNWMAGQESEILTLVDGGAYNSTSKKIELKHGNTVLAEIDATAFIKDGMVSSVTITGGNLVITFNTDAGQEPISIPLTDIFNPANYYTKTQVDEKVPTDISRTASDATFVNGNHVPLFYLRQATSSLAGLMTAAEHNKLDSLPTAQDLNTSLDSIIYDVSAKNPTAGPNNDGKFTLAYILNPSNVNTLIPTAYRKGGMSIKFVQSSDNKYVQYRLMDQTFSTTESDWQGVDEELKKNSKNPIESGTVYNHVEQLQNIAGADGSYGSITLTSITDGYYYNIYAQLVELESFAINNYSISGYVPDIHVKGIVGSSAYICFFDSNNKVLSTVKGSNDFDSDVVVPIGCTTFGVSNSKSVQIEVYIPDSGLVKPINILKNAVGTILQFDSYVDGKYLDNNGDEATLASSRINKYKILTNVSSLHIKANIGSSMYIWFYDVNNNSISKVKGNSNGFDDDVAIPSNAYYIRISFIYSYILSVTQVNANIQKTIDVASEKINLLSQSIGKGLYLDETITGSYLNVYGEYVESEGMNVDVYKLYNITTLHIKARVPNTAYIVFFDTSHKVIKAYKGNNNTGQNIDSDYDVPSDAVNLSVSYSTDYNCEVTATNKGLFADKKINIWENKKIGIIGDSIAVGFNADPTESGFIYVTASILGVSVKNAAIGGWYLGNQEDKSIYKQVNGVSPATKSLTGDEDLIVIFAGTNDFGGSFTIGEPYVTDASGHKSYNPNAFTTCGGLALTIETLYTKYNGYIPIVICLPLHRNNSTLSSWDKNSANKYMEDYIDGIKAVANYYGIPVCDFHNINMNPNIPAANTKYFDDGLHPNTAGHSLMGHILADFLKNNFFDL